MTATPMSARLVLLALLTALAVPAAQAQADGILVLQPAPTLSVDLGVGERPVPLKAEHFEPAQAAGPRGRAAWRGAKIGFLAGVGIGVATTLATAVLIDRRDGCEYICTWHLAAAATVPFALGTAGFGALLGASSADDPRPAVSARAPR